MSYSPIPVAYAINTSLTRAPLQEAESLATGMAGQQRPSCGRLWGMTFPVVRVLLQELDSLGAGMAGQELGRYRLFYGHTHLRGETVFPPQPPSGVKAVLAYAALVRAEEAHAQAEADRVATCTCSQCSLQRLRRKLPAVPEEPGATDSPRAAQQPGGAAPEGGQAERARLHRPGRASESGELGEPGHAGMRGAGVPQQAQAAASGDSTELEVGVAESGGAPVRSGGANTSNGAAGEGAGFSDTVRPGPQRRRAVLQARAWAFAGGHQVDLPSAARLFCGLVCIRFEGQCGRLV